MIEGIMKKGDLCSVENARAIRSGWKKAKKSTGRRSMSGKRELSGRLKSQLGIPGSYEQDRILSEQYFEEYVCGGAPEL